MSPVPFIAARGRGGQRGARAVHRRFEPGSARTWCGKLVTLTSKLAQGAGETNCKQCISAMQRAADEEHRVQSQAYIRLHRLAKVAYETFHASRPDGVAFEFIENGARERWLDVVRVLDLYAKEDE